MSQLTHGLPAVPPMEPEVRERILQDVLVRIEAPTPSRGRRWMPVLTAAAVLLVATAVTIATTLAGTSSDPRPAVGGTATSAPTASAPMTGFPVTTDIPTGDVLDPLPPDPLPADQLPPPSGNPETDAALARCATAVVRSGRAAEYPPTTTWGNAWLEAVEWGYLDQLLTIDDEFGCLLTPESVILTGRTGTSVGGLQLVRVNSSVLLALNPDKLWFTFGGQSGRRVGYPVEAVPLRGADLDGLTITVYERGDLPGSEPGGPGGGAELWSGPVPELAQAPVVVDRVLPRRTDTPDDAELANCLANLAPSSVGGNELWTAAGRHDAGGAAPTALVARVGDVAAGLCMDDPGVGFRFYGDRLRAETGPGGVVTAMQTEDSLGIVLTAPGEGVTRVEIASAADPAGARPCTFLDGLVVCTLDSERPADYTVQPDVVITAYTAGSDRGTVLYPAG